MTLDLRTALSRRKRAIQELLEGGALPFVRVHWKRFNGDLWLCADEGAERRIRDAGTDLSVMRTDDVTAAAGIAPDDAEKLFRMIAQAKYRLGSRPDERETPTQSLEDFDA